MNITIGDRIVMLRKRYGYNQSQLARKLGVSDKAVKNWELNISDPSAANLAKLSQIFNVSTDSLVGLPDHDAVYLDMLEPEEQYKLRAMIQVYIDMTLSQRQRTEEK